MALRMLGRVHHQAEYVRRKAGTADLAGSCQFRFIGRPQLLQGKIDLTAQSVQEILQCRGIRSRIGLLA